MFLFPVLLFLTAAVLPCTAAAAGLPAACYNVQGDSIEGWLPCNTTTTGPSPCCGSVDFCLDNGLCLNGGANNYYSQQGCTDPDWGAPCTWHCPTFTGNYSELWLCGQATEDNRYCCGTDASCCDDTDSTLLSIDVFTAVSRAGNAAAAATTFIATTTVSATATAASTSTTTRPSPSPSPDYYKHTTIGVSTALSLVAVLASAAMFFVGRRWERTHAHKRFHPGGSDGLPDSPAHSLPEVLPSNARPSAYSLVAGGDGSGGGSAATSTGYAQYPPPSSSQHYVQPQPPPPQYHTAVLNGPTTTGDLQQGQQHVQPYASTAYHQPAHPSELVGGAHGLSHELAP